MRVKEQQPCKTLLLSRNKYMQRGVAVQEEKASYLQTVRSVLNLHATAQVEGQTLFLALTS